MLNKTNNKASSSKKELKSVDLVASGVVFTALTAPFSVPLAVCAGVTSAVGATAMHFIDKHNKQNKDIQDKYYLTKWDQLFYSNNIYSGNHRDGIRIPKLQKVYATDEYKTYTFKIPFGVESSDIKKISTAIKEAYNALKVDIDYIGDNLIEIKTWLIDTSEPLFEGSIPNEDWNKLWRAIKMTTKDDYSDELYYPLLLSEDEEDMIKTFVFKFPIGKSSGGLLSDQKFITVKEFLNARQVEIRHLQDNCIEIKAIYKNLPKLIPYEIVPREDTHSLEIVVGKTIYGWKRFKLLDACHNTFVGGAVGSGKSVFVCNAITDLAINNSPDDLEMWLCDLKIVEFLSFKKLKHVKRYGTTSEELKDMISDLLEIMWERYRLFEEKGVKKLSAYNEKVSKDEKLPYIFFAIEEITEYTISATKPEVAEFVKLLSKCRGVGITVLASTQRVVNNYIPRDISSQLMNRVCFKVSTTSESELLTDKKFDATVLRGKGHGCLIDTEIEEFQAFYLDEDNGEITNLLKEHNLLRED